MSPRRVPCGRSFVFASAVLISFVLLATAAGPSPTLAGPPLPPIAGWEAPRIRVWTEDGWRQFQREGGVSLAPERIYDLDLAEGRAATFHWSARPKTGRGEIVGYRWALDIEDILDETPRSGPDDVTRWSPWSAEEASASVGPFGAGAGTGPHFFYVEARDNLGFVSLLTVRIREI